MKRTIFMLLAAASLVSATPFFSAAGGGNCPDSNCHEDTSPQNRQDVTGGELPNDQAAPKGRARAMSLNDLVPTGRAVEKDDGAGNNGHEKLKPQVQPRSPEKDCVENCN